MTDETFATADELLAYQSETNRLAQENMSLANSNWENILPWRLLRWHRVHKQVNANLAEIDRRFNVGEDGFQALLDKQLRRPRVPGHAKRDEPPRNPGQ